MINVDEKDKKEFLEDFEKADINKKLDMWYYAIEQAAIWEEIIEEMSKYATMQALKEGRRVSLDE